MSSIKTFEELEAWQACRTLKVFVVREVILNGYMAYLKRASSNPNNQ